MNNEDQPICYYRCVFRHPRGDRYVLWFTSDERDGVVLSEGRILAFSNEREIDDYAAKHCLHVSQEVPAEYHLDLLQRFVQGSEAMTSTELLNYWNLLSDVAGSVCDGTFLALEEVELETYNHLFYLSDAAPVRGAEPTELSVDELARIREVLARGLEMMRQNSDVPSA